MRFFYTFGIHVYSFLLWLLAPFHHKARLLQKGRKSVFDTLSKACSNDTRSTIWMHVASLGEFEQGLPLLEQIKRQFPQCRIVLTFFSPSGYEVRKNCPLADVVVYLPSDTSYNARRFLEIVRPDKIFFVKYDFWYHYLHEAYLRDIPTYLISAIFRNEQLFFKSYGTFYRNILHFFTAIFVQEEQSEALLKSIDYQHVVVAGDTRVDRVVALSAQARSIAHIDEFKEEKLLLVAGSTWQPDEELLITFLQRHRGLPLKVIFAPHEVHEMHLRQLRRQLEVHDITYDCYTELKREKKQQTPLDVLIIDTIGILSSLYKYADIAYIGGGFGVGIHNTLEPASFGLPIVFGKKYAKFHEAVSLIAQQGAFTVDNYDDLEAIMQKLICNTLYRKEAGATSKSFVDKQKGAVDIILSFCF